MKQTLICRGCGGKFAGEEYYVIDGDRIKNNTCKKCSDRFIQSMLDMVHRMQGFCTAGKKIKREFNEAKLH